jgi:hypothetical protein
MDLVQFKLQAATEAVARAKWFLLATVATSTLIFAHAYIEQFSQEEMFLKRLLENRVKHEFHPRWDCLRSLAEYEAAGTVEEKCKDVQEAKWLDYPLDEFAKFYARIRYESAVIETTLKDLKLNQRETPFIGMILPWHDFVPIMSYLLALFVVGLWLSARSIFSILSDFDRPHHRDLIGVVVHYFFLPIPNRKFGLRDFFIFYPFFVMAISLLLDYWPFIHNWILNNSDVDPGQYKALIIRGVTLAPAFAIIGTSTMLTRSHFKTFFRVIRAHAR